MTVTPTPGRIYRDKYGDRPPYKNQRRIRIVEVFESGARAETLTDSQGLTLQKPRFTTVSFKTLRSGYELLEKET